MNVHEYLLEIGRAERPALIEGAQITTYGQVRERAATIAATLRRAGVAERDRVAILSHNAGFWVCSYLAILKLGATAVPIPGRLRAEHVTEILESTACTAALVAASRQGQLSAQSRRLPLVVEQHSHAAADLHARHDIVEIGGADDVGTRSVDASRDLAALMFTSGSTGRPNAVKVSHRNIVANTQGILAYLPLDEDERLCAVLPFDYCFGTSLLHTTFRRGGALVLADFHYPQVAVDTLQRLDCTGFAGVPSMYQQLVARSSFLRTPWPKLRHVQQAGGALDPAVILQLKGALQQTRVYVMYGQTEATARLSYLPPERLDDKVGSIGRGLNNVALEVLTSAGRPAATDEVGEIVASGPSIALGYWDQSSAPNRFRNGLLYTGDFARKDEDGFLYVLGRDTDFLKIAGHRVSAQEIERVLLRTPGIAEAAVIGKPDRLLGEAPKAFVSFAPGSRPRPLQELLAHCRRYLPIYAVPRDIVVLEELPKNDAGKVLKQSLA